MDEKELDWYTLITLYINNKNKNKNMSENVDSIQKVIPKCQEQTQTVLKESTTESRQLNNKSIRLQSISTEYSKKRHNLCTEACKTR